MRVAVIGANGQLGMGVLAEYQKSGTEATGLTHTEPSKRREKLLKVVFLCFSAAKWSRFPPHVE
jgi:putative NADH-flavin reductase